MEEVMEGGDANRMPDLRALLFNGLGGRAVGDCPVWDKRVFSNGQCYKAQTADNNLPFGPS